MKQKTEKLLIKILDEIEAFDFVNIYPLLLKKTLLIADNIKAEFPEESEQLLEISESIKGLLRLKPNNELNIKYSAIKNDIALLIRQILEIDD